MENTNEIEKRAEEIIQTEEKIPFHKKVWNGIVAIPKAVNNWVHKHPYLTAGGAAVAASAATVVGTAIVNNVIEKHNSECNGTIENLPDEEIKFDESGNPITEDIDTNVDVG